MSASRGIRALRVEAVLTCQPASASRTARSSQTPRLPPACDRKFPTSSTPVIEPRSLPAALLCLVDQRGEGKAKGERGVDQTHGRVHHVRKCPLGERGDQRPPGCRLACARVSTQFELRYEQPSLCPQ